MERNRASNAYSGGRKPTPRGSPIKWKRIIIGIFLFFMLVYAIVTGVISVVIAGEVIRPPLAPVSPIDKNIAYPYATVSFKSRDGATLLYGWHFNAAKTDSVLILVHGFGGNRFPFGERTLELLDAVISVEFNAIVFDLRNSGGAEPGVSAFGLHEKYDVLGAVDYAKNAGYKNIALMGISTGANAAAMAAADTATEDVGAIILDSPLVDVGEFIMRLVHERDPKLPEFPLNIEVPVFAGLYLNGRVADANAAVSLDKFMPRNVQLIHGNNDEITSLSEITALYDGYMSRAVGKISIWNVPGAGHAECFYYATDEYLDRVTMFLRRVFV